MKNSMLIINILFLMNLLCVSFTQAQEFDWGFSLGTYSYSWGNAVAFDNESNVYSVGGFSGTVDFDPGPGTALLTAQGDLDAYILKLDPQGNFLWVGQLNSTKDIDALNIHVSSNGNVVISGIFRGTVDFDPGPDVVSVSAKSPRFDMFVLQLKSNLAIDWVKFISPNGGFVDPKSVLDPLGNIYWGGWFDGKADIDPGPGVMEIESIGANSIGFLIKLNSIGNTVWTNHYTSGHYSGVTALCFDSITARLYVVGNFGGVVDFDPGPGEQFISSDSGGTFVQTLEPSGKLDRIRTMKFGSIASFDALMGKITSIIICGSFRNTVDFDPGPDSFKVTAQRFEDIFVLKLNQDLEFEWVATAGGDARDYGLSLALDKRGNIYTSGNFNGVVDFDPNPNKTHYDTSHGYFEDTYIWKLSPYGDLIGVYSPLVDNEWGATCWGLAMNDQGELVGTGEFAGLADLDPGPNEALVQSKGQNQNIFIFKWKDSCTTQTFATHNVNACGQYRLPGNRLVVTQSGTYQDTIANRKGCDSILTLNVTILPADTTYMHAHSCTTYTAPDGQKYNTPGTYTAQLKNSDGCDSLVYIELTMGERVDTVVWASQNTLTARQQEAQYRWLDCAKAFAPVPGANQRSFTPAVSGQYAVEIKKEACISDTSACYQVWAVSVAPTRIWPAFRVYPNPFGPELILEPEQRIGLLEFALYDLSGRLIIQIPVSGRTSLPTQLMAPGHYLYKVSGPLGIVGQGLVQKGKD